MIPQLIPWLVRGIRSVTGGLSVLLLAAGVKNCPGQVVLDGKFGTSGPLAGPNYTITAGMGAARGNNLFQSFSQFNLVAGDIATFTGPANIQNILSRVTGGSPSSINGTIRSDIAGANFFFINPSGIVFGPNAAVNVSGSFAASTAGYLKLADGARFVASLDADDSALSTAPVSAFGFLGNSPGSIEVQQSTLRVPNLKTIALVGGDVAVERGSVQSPGGQINIVSVRSAGEVPVDPKTLSVADFNASFPQQGQISLQNGPRILDASGTGGGLIVIRGGRLMVDNSKILANTTGTTAGQGIDIALVNDLNLINGGQINSISTSGRGAGGDINLNAQTIRLDGRGLIDQNFNPTTQISTAAGSPSAGGGTAKGGDIVIQAGNLELENSAQISAATFSAGNAGRIEITASSVRLDAMLTTPTQITANTFRNLGGGNAGDIVIRTGTLDLFNGATILAASFGTGKAGLIDINAQSVNLFSGAIVTAPTFGSGSGGNIQITSESMRIDGRNTLTGDEYLTGIQAVTTSLTSPAPGGSIHITAGSVELDHLGSIFTTSKGLGPGGVIEVTAGNLTLANSSSIRAASEAKGRAGNISLRADKDIVLTGNSAFSTSAPGSSGGDISVIAGSEIRLESSQITAQAGLDGGNITVTAPEIVYLLHSTLTGAADTTGSGFGNGGNLTIDPSFLILNDSALISKSSFGNGGNITILSDYFFQSSSLIDSSAPFGLPGTVSVSAPELDLSGSLVGLPSNLLDIEAQLRPDCRVRLAANLSSFIVLGQGGLPIAPGGFVPSGTSPPLDEEK